MKKLAILGTFRAAQEILYDVLCAVLLMLFLVVVDRSGSMRSMRDELVSGLNVFMTEQRKLGSCRVSVIQFDSEIETVLNDVPIESVLGSAARPPPPPVPPPPGAPPT